MKNEQIELIRLLKSVDCQVLKSGYRLHKMEYFFCECDPDQKDPICRTCAFKCHKTHNVSKPYYGEQICHCGINYHIINIEQNDYHYNKRCFFYQWSILSNLKIYYHSEDTNICMFCYNFCKDYQKESGGVYVRKRHIGKFDFPFCECKDNNHLEIKTIFDKLKLISNENNELENLSVLHLINITVKSEHLFRNLFQNFSVYIDKLKVDIVKPSFLFDPNIGFSSFHMVLKMINSLISNTKYFYYFPNNLKDYFDQEFIWRVIDKQYNDSKGILSVKLNMLSSYRKVKFLSDFSICPYFNVNDFMNLNPLFRILLQSNVKEETSISSIYLNNQKYNFIDLILNCIVNFQSIKHKEFYFYLILHKLYSFCKIFAKYNLLSREQVIKICLINEDILSNFNEQRKYILKHINNHNKIDINKDLLSYETSTIVSMIKTIFFMIFNENDNLIYKALKGEIEEKKVEFFHNKNELSKTLSKNIINILNFVRRNFTEMQEQLINVAKMEQTTKIKIKKVFNICNNLITLNMSNPDIYLSSFRSLLDKNKKLYLNYIDNKFSQEEKEFVELLKNKTRELERMYQDYFECRMNFNELRTFVNNSIKSIFIFINKENYSLKKINHFRGDTVLLNEIQDDQKKKFNFIVKNDQDQYKKVHVYPKKKIFVYPTRVNSKPTIKERSVVSDEILRILFNKSFFIQSTLKILKIKNTIERKNLSAKVESHKNVIEVDNEFNYNIFKLFYFYCEENADNCLIILSSEFIHFINDFEANKLELLLDFLINCLETIKLENYMISNNTTLKNIIEAILNKINIKENLLILMNKTLKILKLISDIPCLDINLTKKELKKFLVRIFSINDCIKLYKQFLVNQNKEEFILKIRQINKFVKIFNTINTLRKHFTNTENQGKAIELISLVKENNTLESNQEDENMLILCQKIFEKFLRLIDSNFIENIDKEEEDFLKNVFTLKEIQVILKNLNLNLTLRTQVLKFFKSTYLNFSFDKSKLGSYISVFTNSIKLNNGALVIEDMNNLKFLEELLKINSSFDLIKQFQIIFFYELKYFREVLEYNKSPLAEMLEYIEEGIIFPFYVYIHKFMAFQEQHKGYDYLKLFELVYLFLELKKYIIEKKEELVDFVPLIIKNFFPVLTLNKTYKHLLLSANFNDCKDLERDFKELSKSDFEILNYKKVYQLLDKHLFQFINRPKSTSLLEHFCKKKEWYDLDSRNKLEDKLKKCGYLNSNFEKIVFNLLVKYENDKQKFNESNFVHNLDEINAYYDKNYRFLLIRFICFINDDNVYSGEFKKQNQLNFLKMLQFDTTASQHDISSLYKKSLFNFNNMIQGLIKNFVCIFFNQTDPSLSKLNDDYYNAINTVKIFKYLCEEHNQEFQGIFFTKLKLNYKDSLGKDREISLFSFLLHFLEKIIMLSNWEKVKYDVPDNKISYFYDIFFSINELLIEMIQGTKTEYLLSILEKNEDNEVPAFQLFLNKIRQILMRNKNNSIIVYKVRKDIMDLIVAFLEEKSTPLRIVLLISNLLSPQAILDTMVATMKKLYIKLHINSGINSYQINDYKNILFNSEMYEFFRNKYYFESEFTKYPEYELANRMYHFVKLLADQYKNEEAINKINSIKTYTIAQLNYLHQQKRKNNKKKQDLTISDDIIVNYYCIKFFDGITKTVIVDLEEDGVTHSVRVLFTVNPLVRYLSKSSKKDFFYNVNRETRYTKLYGLIENSDYFFEEALYYHRTSSKSIIIRFINNINYRIIEMALFVLTCVINILLFITLKREGMGVNPTGSSSTSHRDLGGSATVSSTNQTSSSDDSLYQLESKTLENLSIIHLIINSVFIFLWLITQFPLRFIIESRKYLLKYNTKEIELNIWEKIFIVFYTIIIRNEITAFIWNIIISTIGILNPNFIILYSFQLLSIINLSEILKDIVRAMTLRYKQFLATAFFVVVIINIFTSIAFYYLSEDYYDDGYDEIRLCDSLFSCFMTHLNLGLRTDGGIGTYIKKKSLNIDPLSYSLRFFFILGFFIMVIVILLSIMFGIVIDTFGGLREKAHETENDMMNVCFICGASRDELEKHSVNFKKHISGEHYLWTYAEYMFGLKFIDPQETNAVNSYVIGMISNKNISWLPCFKSNQTPNDEEENEDHEEH